MRIHHEWTTRAACALDQFLAELEGMEIGAADSAFERLDQHFARTGRGNRNLVDYQFLVPHNGGAHAISSSGAAIDIASADAIFTSIGYFLKGEAPQEVRRVDGSPWYV
jgi:hypothetical protein